MIDLHCHILPWLDDGPKTLDESLAMARAAVEDGITHILCTPHYNRLYHNDAPVVIEAVEKMQEILDQENIPLTLFEGQEIRIHEELVKDYEQGLLLGADMADRYLMIEFASSTLPTYVDQVLYSFCQSDVTPVIVHPERYDFVAENPNKLIEYIDMGCLLQVTAPSLVGIYGKEKKVLALQLISHGFVHMIASDAHALNLRGFHMKKAMKVIEKTFDQTVVDYFDQVSRALINGEPVKRNNYRPFS
ncbi:MAG: tyrosine protein phosphatase [Streptococcaceae bacterium]|jgi:protein-tyrosine phosphatase|nr:tyrosine protein phosphatase [Streptococcaceae bacterium]